jgi:MSHA biogenesis protein MshI
MPLVEYPHKPANSCAAVRSSPVVSSSFQHTTRYLLQKRRSSSEVALLSLFKKRESEGDRAGVVLGRSEFAIALVRRRTGGKPLVTHCSAYHPDNDRLEADLLAAAQKLQLGRIALSAVADCEDYQLVQVEAPEVLPAELRAAVRWRLRDVISFHIDDAVIDVFEIPDQSRRSQGKMMFAVAARSSAIQRLGASIAPTSTRFDVIDIPELCLRNVAALLPQDQRGVAFLVLHEHHAQLLLTRQGVLYLTRRVELQRSETISFGDDPASPAVDAGALALELQRSLDYYDSHFERAEQLQPLSLAPR